MHTSFARIIAVVAIAVTLGAPLAAADFPGQVRIVTTVSPSDTTGTIMSAMGAELARSKAQLKFESFAPPYFIAYRLIRKKRTSFTFSYGSLYDSYTFENSPLYVETRVGGYHFDNYGSKHGGFPSWMESVRNVNSAPYDITYDALRRDLWIGDDLAYKDALKALIRRQGEKLESADSTDDNLDSFAKAPTVTSINTINNYTIDRETIKKTFEPLSAEFKKYKTLFNDQLGVVANESRRYFMNTEGTSIADQRGLAMIGIAAQTKDIEGATVGLTDHLYVDFTDGTVATALIEEKIDALARDLVELAAAKKAEPSSAPAILDADSSGIYFHEVIGHRLEADRFDSNDNGKTFKGKLGETILPNFISVSDDPTLAEWNGVALNGHYTYDDEGVGSQPVKLIVNGVLKHYLSSRKPVDGELTSNGHGRADDTLKPMSRMGTLIVESSTITPKAKLLAMLKDEIRKQGKPYGYYIRASVSGETNTSVNGVQSYRSHAQLIYKVYPDRDKMELVRGIDLIGTPLTTLNKIVAMSDDYYVFNGYCGVESGWVPVSAIAPSMLFSEIEVQRSKNDEGTPFILPPPLFAAKPATTTNRK